MSEKEPPGDILDEHYGERKDSLLDSLFRKLDSHSLGAITSGKTTMISTPRQSGKSIFHGLKKLAEDHKARGLEPDTLIKDCTFEDSGWSKSIEAEIERRRKRLEELHSKSELDMKEAHIEEFMKDQMKETIKTSSNEPELKRPEKTDYGDLSIYD